MDDLSTEAARRRAIALATALATNTSLAPQAYERTLLERYALGELTLDQVLQRLDTRVQQLFYRSRATQAFAEDHLRALMDESRAHNEAHGITGVLCYSERQFVQLLEGTPEHVHALYERIQRDPRHAQVTTLYDEASGQRFFANWQMGFVRVDADEFHWVLTSLARPSDDQELARQYVQDPALRLLLEAFTRA
ncbi:BLUF domain protein [Hymenobacter roseosalivarius DSM 11622]|uniref:BLUF domain protein n=1 Tax=Hymenobacter roseosalivarius DSM 11622 TaxID=645990 RepID=A0A1W1W013_9BACT|nr:BLUF domain-containing protein [Hymenobacter roseosalivarius]SMB98945.1 BLUF domain protein [Hymenobacter roseosalivarius DSM 11622]